MREKDVKKQKSNEELAKAIQNGEIKLTEDLWEQVSGLVKWRADRAINALKMHGNPRGLEFEDLMQIGFIAMLSAVESFNPANGAFSTWLVYHIRTAFADAAGYRTKNCDPVNLSISLDQPLPGDPDTAFMHEIIPDPGAAEMLDLVEESQWNKQLHDVLEEILAELPEKSREVLRRRYYQSQTLAEVGNAFSVGTEMARQLELKALRELRKPRNARRLRPFLDFDVYSGTGLGAFIATGMSVQERFLVREETSKYKTSREDRQF